MRLGEVGKRVVTDIDNVNAAPFFKLAPFFIDLSCGYTPSAASSRHCDLSVPPPSKLEFHCMKPVTVLAAGLLMALASTTASAAEGNGAFIRAELGQATADYGFTDDTDNGFSVRGGYWFNANIAVEGSFTSYGRGKIDSNTDYDIFGLAAGVVAKKNFGDGPHQGFYISGRAGASYNDVAYIDDDNNVTIYEDGKEFAPYIGVGIGYDINERFGLGLNYDYQDTSIEDADVKLHNISFSGEFRF